MWTGDLGRGIGRRPVASLGRPAARCWVSTQAVAGRWRAYCRAIVQVASAGRATGYSRVPIRRREVSSTLRRALGRGEQRGVGCFDAARAPGPTDRPPTRRRSRTGTGRTPAPRFSPRACCSGMPLTVPPRPFDPMWRCYRHHCRRAMPGHTLVADLLPRIGAHCRSMSGTGRRRRSRAAAGSRRGGSSPAAHRGCWRRSAPPVR